jgi:hypothetical protein
LVKVTSPGTFPTADSFDKLYRGEPSVEGGPKPAGVPWDVHQAQPRLMELEALGGIAGEVIDSALYHCLDEDARQAYAAGLHRATRPAARWHLYCFSDGNVNGMTAPMGAAPEVVEALLHGPRTIGQNIRDTLTANGWRINFFGPTTYMANIRAFTRDLNDLPQQLREKVSPATLEQMRGVNDRFATIVNLIDDDRVHLPFHRRARRANRLIVGAGVRAPKNRADRAAAPALDQEVGTKECI